MFRFMGSYFLLKIVSPCDLASSSVASASITLSQIIAESSIILIKYFPFSQLYAVGF